MNTDTELTDRQARVNVLFKTASTRLMDSGQINLGLLIYLMTMGDHFAHDEYAQLIAEHKYLFANDVDDMSDLYELVLNLLEQAHGPLVCDPKKDEAAPVEIWGYASTFSNAPSPLLSNPVKPEQLANTWALRIRALDTGHPDQTWYGDDELPHNTWRLASGPAGDNLSAF
jgi:hypothetical protein